MGYRNLFLVNPALPAKGSVRMLVITEKQYNAIELLVGRPTPYDRPQQDEQLLIFKKNTERLPMEIVPCFPSFTLLLIRKRGESCVFLVPCFRPLYHYEKEKGTTILQKSAAPPGRMRVPGMLSIERSISLTAR